MERVLLQHPDIPEARRVAAETVRAHLVHHRGGAPFLSPSDTLLLVDWLEAEVSVVAMLTAIERCATSRRRSRARSRFTLRSAKRHLHKPPLERVDLEPDASAPLRPVVEQLTAHPDPAAHALARTLEDGACTPVEELVARCTTVLEEAWNALSEAERHTRLEAARRELGDLAALVDAATLDELAEEVARASFRADFPRVDATTLAHLVTP
jgi:hypothetical protein